MFDHENKLCSTQFRYRLAIYSFFSPSASGVHVLFWRRTEGGGTGDDGDAAESDDDDGVERVCGAVGAEFGTGSGDGGDS